MPAEYTVVNNEKLMHFEIQIGSEIAFMEYRFHNNNIALMHTEVPEHFEGKGAASTLAKYAFNYAKAHHQNVLVYCPFVQTYVKRHPELKAQIVKE